MTEARITLLRRLAAELIGSLYLVATIIGSGIAAEALSGGNVAVALLGNTLAIAATLYVLIVVLQPVSGAHFNPAVSLIFALRGELPWREAGLFVLVQVAGGLAGVIVAHLMFDQAAIQLSQKVRWGDAQWFSEFVATFGLISTIFYTARARPEAMPSTVALYIFAACWFTSSGSFANPAVTLARSFSQSFASIRGWDVPGFVFAQFAGAIAALAFWRLISSEYRDKSRTPGGR